MAEFNPDSYAEDFDPETYSAEPGPSATDRALAYLDYDRAVTGGPLVAKALEAISGKDVYRPEELEASAKLQRPYPSAAEFLDRAGYLKDWPKARLGAGLALDIASSPSTYATGGLGALSKIFKGSKLAKGLETGLWFTQPGTEALQVLGKKMWKAPFKHMDAEAMKAGKTAMPSEILTAPGVDVAAFTRKGLHEKTAEVADQILVDRNKILQEATDAGGKIDVDVATERARELVTHYRSLGVDQADEVADALEKEIAGFDRLRPAPEKTQVVQPAVPGRTIMTPQPHPLLQGSGGQPLILPQPTHIPGTPAVTRTIPARPGASPAKASDIKTFFYRGAPSKEFQAYADTQPGKDFSRALAIGLKDATEEATGRALGPAAETQLSGLNERLGSLLSTRKKDLGEVTREEMRNLFTNGDALAIGAAASGDPARALHRYWIMKKAADVMTAPGPWTVLGRGMSSQAPLTWRAGRTVAKRAPLSPWSLLEDNDGKEEK